MSALWLWVSAALVLTLVPCGVVVLHGSRADRLAGLEAASAIVTLALLAIAQGLQRDMYNDLAVTLALLAFGGGMVFARFIERWL